MYVFSLARRVLTYPVTCDEGASDATWAGDGPPRGARGSAARWQPRLGIDAAAAAGPPPGTAHPASSKHHVHTLQPGVAAHASRQADADGWPLSAPVRSTRDSGAAGANVHVAVAAASAGTGVA